MMQCNILIFCNVKNDCDIEIRMTLIEKQLVSTRCQFHFLIKRDICNKVVKKMSLSPWKHAFSPLACAKPDK